MSVEKILCDGFGMRHCLFFSRARRAIAVYRWLIFGHDRPLFCPSNVCPLLANALGNPVFLPVDKFTGLSKPTRDLAVQLYGFRNDASCALEIDPAFTGWKREPKASSIILSFGYSKTIDIGEGAAFLTNEREIANDLWPYADWTPHMGLESELTSIDDSIERRRDRLECWDEVLPKNVFFKPSVDPIVPWRCIRLIETGREKVISALRGAGIDVGTNYPPLPGCTDPSSVEWGNKVINFWVTRNYDRDRIRYAGRIIEKALAA